MPNLNEIAKFRQELKNIAHENEVLASWGDRLYDELPPPDPAEVPDIDLDALLSATGSGEHTDAPAASGNAARFDTVPVTDSAALSEDTSFPSNFGGAAPQKSTEAPQTVSKPSASSDGIVEDSGAAYPVDDEGMPDLEDMDSFLSSFNLDDIPGDTKPNTADSSGGFDMDTPAADISETGSGADYPDIPDTSAPGLEDVDISNWHNSNFPTPEEDDHTGFADESPVHAGSDNISASGLDNDTSALDDDDTGFSFDDDLFGDTFPADSDEPHESKPQGSSTDTDDPLNFDDILSSFGFDEDENTAPAADGAPAFDTGSQPAAADTALDSAADDANFSLDDLNIPDFDPSSLDTSFGIEPDTEAPFGEPRSAGNADPFNAQSSDDPFDLSSLDFPDSPQPDGEDAFAGLEPSADEDRFEIPDIDDSFSLDMPSGFDDSSEPNPETAGSSPQSKASSSGNFDDLGDELSLYSEQRDDPDNTPAEQTPDTDSAPEDSRTDAPDIDLSAFNFTPSEDFSDSSAAQPTDTAQDTASDMPEAGYNGMNFFAQQPESDTSDQNESGFSLDDNPLDTDINEVSDDQFNLPDNFKDFSADTHSKMFDSVIAKSTGVGEEADPLSISDDDYFAFLNRLELFPLNVQLAIQKYIATHEDSPDKKMDFIRYVLANNSLKKVANKLGELLNTTIPIPRGFQRKSVEEYEWEKKTFKYWFVHRFLPVAVMSGIALILIFCISVLSWQFIYKPVKSESLYKSGYAYLQNEHYETAIEKFNKAGEVKRKKKWYFSYARAFRAKKQFTSAEKMYTRLIYDFDYDKQAGLEYADMLSTDLRNYEKAESILRRRLLDQHVNDKDGLLALGDIYMNWADEDPEKYDAAVKIYSRLIELYGENDTYLLRMMRFFIRTDNLAEALRLKEHFSPRIEKIGARNLTELSGYLLEKRYNPKPLDSETLRQQIDDVRLLLEKAVQADKTMPEAYYNLGRFFIYNNRQDGAIENLTEAISLFKTAAPMTARRTVSYVDAMRLLGEQLVTQKKYLDAQTLYADALTVYRDYTAFKPLPPNQNIGKLYADYGDIDYFISYNFDSALDNYQHAVKELYDTPSVQYRIGYIHYQQENYEQAIEAISRAYAEKPRDKNLLYGFGNTFFKRGDYFAALAAYEQLFSLLNAQRSRKEHFLSSARPDDAAFMEQYMQTANNLGATLNRLAERTGDSQKNGRSLALFAEATRAWDALTRNPQTMIRAKSVGLAYLNTQNMLNAKSPYDSEIYTDISMILENERPLEQNEDQ